MGLTGVTSTQGRGRTQVAPLCPCRRQGSGQGLGAGTSWFLVTDQRCHFLLVALGQSSSTTTWPACPKRSKRLPKQNSPSPQGEAQEVLLPEPQPAAPQPLHLLSLPRPRPPA